MTVTFHIVSERDRVSPEDFGLGRMSNGNTDCVATFFLLKVNRGGSRIFFRRGCTRILLYFNTNKPHSFFCRIPVVLENRRSSQGGGGGAHPLHPSPRSAPGENGRLRRAWSELGIGKIERINLSIHRTFRRIMNMTGACNRGKIIMFVPSENVVRTFIQCLLLVQL